MRAIIEGGRRPVGKVKVSGAKNSATRLLAGALLSDQPVVLGNFPTRLVDVGHKVRFIRDCGGAVAIDDARDDVTVTAAGLRAPELPDYDYPIRTTYLLVAGQMLRNGVARVPYPGGCRIGSRGYDLHVMVWERLGAQVQERPSHLEIAGRGFTGAEIRFPISTVGGTENALLCGAIARGETDIVNAYVTPEIEDLIALLRRMGAEVEVTGGSRIRVRGRGGPLSGARMEVMPDRIEALTWIVHAAMTRGEVLVQSVPFAAMRVPLLHLADAGLDLLVNADSAFVYPGALRGGEIQPFELACGTHPGVISDMQPFFTMLGLAATGVSRIHDYRYPERIAYADELARFCPPGAVTAVPGRITTEGPVRFHPAEATSTDLRGSMALILAALAAEGSSVVHAAEMALRGYNGLPEKLAGLGTPIAIAA